MKTVFSIFALLALLFPSVDVLAAASGGDSMGGMETPSQPRKSPEQVAADNFKRGLKDKEDAWEYEAKAASETDEKKKQKLLKKAQKQYVNAQKYYKKTLKAFPTAFEVHSELGYVYRKSGQYKESLESYDEALRLKADFAPAIEYRGEAYLGLNRLSDAKAAYMALFQMDREQSKKLMTAMEQWVQASDAQQNISAEEKTAFAQWLAERKQLEQQTSDLNPSHTGDWVANSSTQ